MHVLRPPPVARAQTPRGGPGEQLALPGVRAGPRKINSKCQRVPFNGTPMGSPDGLTRWAHGRWQMVGPACHVTRAWSDETNPGDAIVMEEYTFMPERWLQTWPGFEY